MRKLPPEAREGSKPVHPSTRWLIFPSSCGGNFVSGGRAKPFAQPLAAIMLALLFTCWPAIGGAASDPPSDLDMEVVVHLTGNGTPGPYRLKDHLIFENTDVVQKNGLVLRRDVDYSMDYDRGQISFSAALYTTDSLEIRYKKFKFNLRRRYFHRELVRAASEPPAAQSTSIRGTLAGVDKGGGLKFPSRQASSEIVLSGSKTFSFEVGSSEDVSLKQGLRLSAKGNAARNLEVSLQLSDQNMPALPEGSTKRLAELDKVQMLVKSRNFSGTLGDYYLTTPESELSFYQKKLKGVTAQARSGRASASVAFASTNGESFTNRFYGQDNKQGPYRLKGRNGETNITVLPGTESVWVDGEKMERGSNNDYSIDYGRGTLEFTPRRLVTSETRIAVDFEYSVEDYRRDFHGANVGASFLDGRLKLKASGILEEDDRNRPSAFTLSAEDRKILSDAGSDRIMASRDGAEFVGKGQGEYELAHDSLGVPYYRYAGSDSGSYRVSFSWVGPGKGSYSYIGGGICQYVYPGNGGFSPVVLLPLPESHSLLDLSLSLRPAENLKAEMEWAKSKRDKNTFSGKDDENNWGDALLVRSAYHRTDFQFLKPEFHLIRLEGEYRLIGRDFAPFGRVEPVEKARTWGLTEESVSTDEKTYQFSGLVAPSKSFQVDFGYGKLQAEGEFAVRKMSLGTQLVPVSWASAKAKTERIKSRMTGDGGATKDGLQTRNLVVLSSRYRRLYAELSWQRERNNAATWASAAERDNFDQLGGEVSLGLSPSLRTSTQLTYREGQGFQEKKSFGYSVRQRLSLRDFRAMLSSDLEFTRRIKKQSGSEGSENKWDLVTSRMDFYPPSQIVNVKFYHSQNQIHSSRRVDSYLEVEEGRGNYRYEDGDYVADPEGDFVRLSEWVGEGQPSSEVNKSVRVIFSPNKLSSRERPSFFWWRVARLLSTDSFLSLRGRLAGGRSLAFYFLYPLTGLPDKEILSQNVLVRHDLYFLDGSRPLNLRFRWEKSEEAERLLSNGDRQHETLKHELLLRSRISSVHFLELQIDAEEIEDKREGGTRDLVMGKGVSLGFTRRQARALELNASAQYRRRDQEISGTRVDIYSLSPKLVWSLLSRGRLKAEFRWTHLASPRGGGSLSYALSDGKGRGENCDWRLFFDYKWGSHIVTSAAYSGEVLAHRRAYHRARMELKAVF